MRRCGVSDSKTRVYSAEKLTPIEKDRDRERYRGRERERGVRVDWMKFICLPRVGGDEQRME